MLTSPCRICSLEIPYLQVDVLCCPITSHLRCAKHFFHESSELHPKPTPAAPTPLWLSELFTFLQVTGVSSRDVTLGSITALTAMFPGAAHPCALCLGLLEPRDVPVAMPSVEQSWQFPEHPAPSKGHLPVLARSTAPAQSHAAAAVPAARG